MAAGAGNFPPAAAKAVTVEMLVRLGAWFNVAANTTMIGAPPSATPANGTASAAGVQVVFDRHALAFSAGGRVLSVHLNGVGVKTYYHLLDNNWHHLAFRFDASVSPPQQSIWVDGQCPDGFGDNNATVAGGMVGSAPFAFLPDSFDGDIDEVAVYDRALSNSSIYQHFTEAFAHTPYTAEDRGAPVPAPAPVTEAYDPADFAPGSLVPTWAPEAGGRIVFRPRERTSAYFRLEWGCKVHFPREPYTPF